MKNNISLINDKFENFNISDHLEKNDKISLIFLDPPDNIKVKYDNYCDNLTEDQYRHKLIIWIVKACEMSNCPVFISFNEKYIPDVEDIIREWKIPLIQRIYWYFTFGQSQKNKYTPSVRPIYWLNNNTFYSKEILIKSDRQKKYNDKRANNKGKVPDNVWQYSRICGTFREKKKWHCNQHPMSLMERIILGHSKENDIVLDGFIGSGTTAYVCKKYNRKCIGIDISKFYLDQIKKELNSNG